MKTFIISTIVLAVAMTFSVTIVSAKPETMQVNFGKIYAELKMLFEKAHPGITGHRPVGNPGETRGFNPQPEPPVEPPIMQEIANRLQEYQHEINAELSRSSTQKLIKFKALIDELGANFGRFRLCDGSVLPAVQRIFTKLEALTH